MAKYFENNGKKKHIGLKIFLGVVLLILILVLALFLFIWSKLDLVEFDNEIDKSVYQTQPSGDTLEDPDVTPDATDTTEEIGEIVDTEGLEQVETAPPIPETEVVEKKDVMNILLIGTDERSKEFSVNARSDSMILVSIDRDKNTVKLVSLERGMAAPVLEGQYAGQYDWLTHIFRYGGSDLLVKTVEECFKIEVDNYIRLNFNSVTQIVDAVGGIDIELTKAEAAYLSHGLGLNLIAGVNHVDGEAALAYARLREIDSDWQRVGRQREVILAIVDALKGSNLLELNALADQVLPMIQTDLTKLQIADLMLYSPNFLKASFDQMTIPTKGTYGSMKVMGGRVAYAVDFEVNSATLREFFYGTDGE